MTSILQNLRLVKLLHALIHQCQKKTRLRGNHAQQRCSLLLLKPSCEVLRQGVLTVLTFLDGLQPKSNGLQPTSDGLQLNTHLENH